MKKQSSITNISRVAENNRLSVLQELRRHRKLSRQQLAQTIGLDSSTLSKMIAELIQQGILEEAGKASTSGAGKKQILLRMVSKRGAVLGGHLTPGHIHLSLLDLCGEVIKSEVQALENIDELELILEQFIESSPCKVCAVGLAIPGIINNRQQITLRSRYFSDDTALGDKLNKRLGLPIQLENAANAAAIGEVFSNPMNDTHTNLIYFNITWPYTKKKEEPMSAGFGSGLILNDDLISGHNFGAGELGLQIDPACRQLLSEKELVLLATKNAPINLTIEKFTELLIPSLLRFSFFLNPERIIIGSNRDLCNQQFFIRINHRLNERLEGFRQQSQIFESRYKQDAPAIGAAWSALQQLPFKAYLQ